MDNLMKNLVLNQKLTALENDFKSAPNSEMFTESLEIDAMGSYDNLNDFILELEAVTKEIAAKYNVTVKGV